MINFSIQLRSHKILWRYLQSNSIKFYYILSNYDTWFLTTLSSTLTDQKSNVEWLELKNTLLSSSLSMYLSLTPLCRQLPKIRYCWSHFIPSRLFLQRGVIIDIDDSIKTKLQFCYAIHLSDPFDDSNFVYDSSRLFLWIC